MDRLNIARDIINTFVKTIISTGHDFDYYINVYVQYSNGDFIDGHPVLLHQKPLLTLLDEEV